MTTTRKTSTALPHHTHKHPSATPTTLLTISHNAHYNRQYLSTTATHGYYTLIIVPHYKHAMNADPIPINPYFTASSTTINRLLTILASIFVISILAVIGWIRYEEYCRRNDHDQESSVESTPPATPPPYHLPTHRHPQPPPAVYIPAFLEHE
jgi:hypothetical protein